MKCFTQKPWTLQKSCLVYEIVGHFVFVKLFLVSWILNEIACMSQCNKQNSLSNLFDFVALVLFIHLLCFNEPIIILLFNKAFTNPWFLYIQRVEIF